MKKITKLAFCMLFVVALSSCMSIHNRFFKGVLTMEDLTLVVGVIALLICVLWGLACSAIVRSKGYDKHEQNIYFFLGFFLNIIGVIIAAVKSPIVNRSDEVHASTPGTSSSVDPVWKCSFCGTQNIGSESYSKCSSCRHTRGESQRNKSNSKSNNNNNNNSFGNSFGNNNSTNNNNDLLTDLDALKKLKELLDMGAITQEEFDSKKAKLLK